MIKYKSTCRFLKRLILQGKCNKKVLGGRNDQKINFRRVELANMQFNVHIRGDRVKA
jgi:hypothetical protein